MKLNAMNIVRLLFWICLAIVWICFCDSVWLIWRSQQPEQGAIMYFMGLALVGPPLVFAAIFAIGLVLVDRTTFKPWECWLAWLAGVLALSIGVAGFWL